MLTKREIEILELVPEATDDQRQPTGIDLTVLDVERYAKAQRAILRLEQREIPNTRPERTVDIGKDVWHLDGGSYLLTYREKICLPNDVAALVFPRSSLMRMGCQLHTAVWDPGYEGRGKGLLVVPPHGLILERGTRIGQVVFFRLAEITDTYEGVYQWEGLN